MKTKTLFLVMIVIIITLSACEKTEIISDGPSQSVLDKGTSVGDSVTCRDSVLAFIACMDSMRKLSGGPPAYYDERLLDLGSTAIGNQYYLGENGIQWKPVIDGLSIETINSVKEWSQQKFAGIENILLENDSTYSGSYSRFIGRYGDWERFLSFDLYAVRIKEGTACQVGQFRLEIIVLTFVSQDYWVQNN